MRALLLCLFLIGCATAPGAGGATAFLEAGVRAPAPEGLMDYCRREPAECGGAVEAVHVVPGSTGAARTIAAQAPEPTDAVLQAVAVARHADRERGPQSSSRVALDDARLRDLRQVARDVLAFVNQDTDLAIYGRSELWRRPIAFTPLGARGDCEDIALEMRARLIARGWPTDALALAVAITPDTGLHAALIAQTDRGDFVLDSLNDGPTPIASLNYVWLTRQSGPTLSYWTTARLTVRWPQAAPAAPELAEPEALREVGAASRMPIAYLGAGRNRIRP